MERQYKITLNSGIEIHLDCLFQYRTYCGLYEGWPTRELNRKFIERAIGYAAEKLWSDGKPHLILPAETSMGVPRSEWFCQDDLSEPVTLPDVVCLATFDSSVSARDPNAHLSSLKLVWFQDGFGLPVGTDVLSKIREIDGRAIATDGYW